MSISIYYTARRSTPLTNAERAEIDAIEEEFSVEVQLQEYHQSGEGLNWESFCIYDYDNPTEVGVVFEGATKLPDNSEDAMWRGVQHWCAALSSIRNTISGAEWDVRVDDHEIQWDVALSAFDPSQ